MSILRITRWGESVLHKKSKSVDDITPDLLKTIEDMYETMYAAIGIGLAAPQVGIPLRLAVVNVTPENRKSQFVMINPRIIKKSGRIDSDEGCLSLPGVGGCTMKRYEKVTVKATDDKGQDFTIEGDGLLARCLQHEIDHLDGKMIIDRTSLKQRLKMKWAIRKLKKEKIWD